MVIHANNTNTIYSNLLHNNTLTKVFTIISTILLSSSLLAGLLLTSSTSSADVVDDVSITVPVACGINDTLDTPHTATINPGQVKEDIGTTTFKVFCNDNTGYALYAIGYSNEEYGNTNLLPTNTSNPSIVTGLATSGNTSNWAMKLTPVTTESSGTEQPYVPTIESDTNGSFASYHIVPEEYTKVATFTSTTDFTIGSSLTSTYRAYIQGMQPADTYQGKVKYTLVHPNDAAPPEKPITPQETATIPNGSIGEDTMCSMLRAIANEGDYLCGDNDDPTAYSIKAIKMATSLPEGGMNIGDCDYYTQYPDYCEMNPYDYNPIYAYFDNRDNAGIIYFYTNARKIIFNGGYRAFADLPNLVDISGLANWDTSGMTDASGMFSDGWGNGSSLTSIDALSNWDTSSVTNMGSMFYGASSLTNIDALSNWDTSSVMSMFGMFELASSLIDIGGAANWNTSNVTNINRMFYDVNSIDATVLNNWDVSKVTNKSNAFTCPADKRPSWY